MWSDESLYSPMDFMGKSLVIYVCSRPQNQFLWLCTHVDCTGKLWRAEWSRLMAGHDEKMLASTESVGAGDASGDEVSAQCD